MLKRFAYYVAAYFYNLLKALDQLFNAVRGGAADATISADAWHADQEGRIWGRVARPAIDALFGLFGEKDHCQNAWSIEAHERINAPKHMAERAIAGGPWTI